MTFAYFLFKRVNFLLTYDRIDLNIKKLNIKNFQN